MNDFEKQTPIKNLDVLIKNMEPVEGPACAFCQIDYQTFKSLDAMPLAMFSESEGVTAIYPVEVAESLGLPISWTGTQITLNVHSSLDAVGFLARITTALAKQGISVNAFSPVSHDHLFVKPEDAEKTMSILIEMIRAAG